MGAAGGVCTVTHASVLTEDNTLESEESGSRCFSMEYFLLKVAKGIKIYSFLTRY